jgi:hypothetical protein
MHDGIKQNAGVLSGVFYLKHYENYLDKLRRCMRMILGSYEKHKAIILAFQLFVNSRHSSELC